MKSLKEIQAAIRAGELNCEKLVRHYHEKIKAAEALNIYLEVFEKEALERAAELDKKFQNTPGKMGKLFGAVISIKDVLCYQNHTVTAASKILGGFRSPYSATAVTRLQAEDAIIIGRVNCDEFAMGSSNENSFYGAVKNPLDPARVPGGSSGGSAAAVAAGTCLASIGSDTGGSVRQPAAFCGVVGFKPAYGRISRHGLIAYASSFDQIGLLTQNVEDTAILLEVIAGPDDFDATAADTPAESFSTQLHFSKKAKIAFVPEAVRHEGIDPEIRAQTEAFLENLKEAGHAVEAVSFDYLDYVIPAYYVLTTAEASSNLARYDGIRYGYRSPSAGNLAEVYKKSRTEGFGAEVKRRIMLGTFVLSAGYYDAYYTKAQQVRRLIQQQTEAILKDFDFLVMPVSPVPPWKFGEKSGDPVAMYLADIFTVQANMAGIPAIAFPIGKMKNDLPVGIQFMSAKFEEAKLLAFAKQVEERRAQSF